MRTSMLLATIAAVGAATVGCAQGSRSATYRAMGATGPVAGTAGPTAPERYAVSAPRYAPPLARAPVSSGGTVVLSSRPAPVRIVPSPVAAPAPAVAVAPGPFEPVFAPATAVAGASGRPVNATCPVMLGNPVDPAVTAVYQGRVIAFSDYTARWKWNTDPSRYADNLPRTASGSASDLIPVGSPAPVFASRTATPAPANEVLPVDPTLPSFDSLPPVRSAPVLPPPGRMPAAAAAVTSPHAMPPLVPPTPPAATAKAPAPAPAAAPSFEDLTHGEDEECPGGNCRLPGR